MYILVIMSMYIMNQTRYTRGHRSGMDLHRVYNVIVTTVGKDLQDLSTAFATINYGNLIYILEIYIQICGNAFLLLYRKSSN